MDPLNQTRLRRLMRISTGDPKIIIGLIDGPVEFNHPAFQESRISAIRESQIAACKDASSIACIHGTFIAGILCAKRGVSVPAICPGCTVLLRPIFTNEAKINSPKKHNDVGLLPTSSPEELSDAIIEIVDAGARIINLSLGLSSSSLTRYTRLEEAYDYARQHGAIIVAAVGNQGNIGSTSLIQNQWVIPVAACDENGRLDVISNFGSSIGCRGLMAPGINITSTASSGGYIQMSGTSFAAPFVTGTVALLWSIFPNASVANIIRAVRTVPYSSRPYRSIIPQLLDAEAAWDLLQGKQVLDRLQP
jgi:subtilisin family serine protease